MAKQTGARSYLGDIELWQWLTSTGQVEVDHLSTVNSSFLFLLVPSIGISMESVGGDSTEMVGSSTAGMPPPGFQKASDVLKASPSVTSLPGPSSNRNASNGDPSPAPGGRASPNSSPASKATVDGESSTPSAPVEAVNKPINRPATSKNAIVYNAVQVSYLGTCACRSNV